MTLEVAVATSQVSTALAVLERGWFAGADGEDEIPLIDRDSGAPITCPACGTESPADAEECTDCGLRL